MLYHDERLANVDPALVALVQDVGAQRDVIVIQGARPLAEEQADIAAGRSSLTNPLDSKHVIDPTLRPLALAVDMAPYPVDWSDIPAFQGLGTFVKERAVALNTGIAWGGDWVHLHDFDHFELTAQHGETI